MRKPVTLAAIAAALLSSLAMSAVAQKRKDVPKRQAKTSDPYTKGDEAAMKKAGYVSFGPFVFGDDHDTLEIRKLMPTVPLIFVETAHFKIGSALPPFALPKTSKRKRALYEELKELKKRLPNVKSRPRKLDRWLRLHLYAVRFEKLYAEMSDVLGVKDADFPRQTVALGTAYQGKQMGEGPYLGNRGKYAILLLQKASNLGRYTLKVSGQRQPLSLTHTLFFQKQGSNFVGIHTEMSEGHLADDHAMHCHAVYCMSLALVMGYKGFRFRLPQWIAQGIAHWHVHRIDPLEHSFCEMKDGFPVKQFDPRWNKNVRGLVKHGSAPEFPNLMRIEHFTQLDFLDHMTSWSRVDFLVTRRKAGFHAFMSALKNPIRPVSGRVPSFEQVLIRQEEALKTGLGYDPAAFDQAWAAFVVKTYPRT